MKLPVSVMYDYQIFTTQTRGGISKYFVSLAEAMSTRRNVHAFIYAPVYINRHLRDNPRAPRIGCFVKRIRGTGWLRNVCCEGLTARTLRQKSLNIIHQTFFSARYASPSGTRVVTTLYDMIPERLYGNDSYWAPMIGMKAAAVKLADRVLCISENTRRDALEILGGDESKYVVTHLACDLPEPKWARAFRGPYLLYVGARSQYKNFRRFLVAYASSPMLPRELQILCVGGGRFTRQEREKIALLGIPTDRVFQADLDDAELAEAYRQAVALVYPSEYEGFGLPLLEAMKSGCPVVCSKTSSIPEVTGDAAEYFNPYEVDSIRHALESVVLDTEHRASLSKRGKERASQFTWQRCADETLAVYLSCL